jgi:hypothetical protein
MAVTRLRMQVEMEGGSTWEVDTDQRDQARFEMQDFYRADRMLLKQRFMAYVASAREKKTNLSWPKFDAACVEVIAAADDQSTEVDPTKPDPSGAP